MTGRKPGSVMRDLERAVEQIKLATARRDNLAREALAANVPAKDVAVALGVSVQRVYQIRDGRR